MVKIDKLRIKQVASIEEIECKPINLILGANNTGKSTLLRESQDIASSHNYQQNTKWLEGVTIKIEDAKEHFLSIVGEIDFTLGFQEINRGFNKLGFNNIYGLNWNETVFSILRDSTPTELLTVIDSTSVRGPYHHLSETLTQMSIQGELCDSRLQGPFSATINELDSEVQNMVHHLFLHNDIFHKLYLQVKETFNIELIFDDKQQGNKHIRLKPQKKITKEELLNNISIADFWRSNSPLLQEQGDGIKAFVRLAFVLFNPAKSIIFIDEPEAFLHPPQRRSLGKFLGENIQEGKQLFISTHDSEFLRGLLTSNINKSQIQVIHLRDNTTTKSFNLLKFSDLYTQSVEYSESILNAFFHKKTVLCEYEDDRMIYQHASRKYFSEQTVDIQFIGLNGKTEVLKIYNILRSKGLDTYCILDIDFLYERDVLNSCINYVDNEKQKVNECMNLLQAELGIGNRTKKHKKLKFQQKGIYYFKDISIRQKVIEVIDILKSKGIMVVPVGTLESLVSIKKTDDRKVQKAINTINTTRKRELYKILSSIVKE